MGISKALCLRLAESARTGPVEYQREYVDSFHEIIEAHRENAEFAGSVETKGAADAANALKFSTLYNEVTFLDPRPQGSMVVAWMAPEGFRRIVGGESFVLSVAGEMPEALARAVERGALTVGFFQPNDEGHCRFMSDAADLIRDGRLIPRPQRAIIYPEEIDAPLGAPRNWQVQGADPGTNSDIWRITVEEEIEKRANIKSLSIESAVIAASTSETLHTISLPYIEKLSLSDHARVLRDEADLLTEFRKEMRDLASRAGRDGMYAHEFKRDVIDPRIAKIGRKFRHIANMQALKSAGAVVVAGGLSLLAWQTKGALGGIEALIGSAGAASILKDTVDRANQVQALKDDPLYLLWKMSKHV